MYSKRAASTPRKRSLQPFPDKAQYSESQLRACSAPEWQEETDADVEVAIIYAANRNMAGVANTINSVLINMCHIHVHRILVCFMLSRRSVCHTRAPKLGHTETQHPQHRRLRAEASA